MLKHILFQKGKNRNEISDATSLYYQALIPTLPCSVVLPSLASVLGPETTSDYGSSLAELYIQYNWLFYPIPLNNKEYFLASKQSIHRHTLGKQHGSV